MKKSVLKTFLALVFVTVAFIGCTPAPMPVSATLTPSPTLPTFTSEPTSTATPLPSKTPTSIPTDTPATPLDPGYLSIADTKTVEFLGKKFELKIKVTDQSIPIFEYYPPNQTPSDWIELVGFQIFPVNPDGNKPIDFAKRSGEGFIKQYPDMTYEILTDDNSETVLLVLYYPTSTRKVKGKQFLEFDAWKIFRDPRSDQIIWFHYAKNIEFISNDSFISEFMKTRKEVLSALIDFPIFTGGRGDPILSNTRTALDEDGNNTTSTFGAFDTIYVVNDLANGVKGNNVSSKWYAENVDGVDPNFLIDTVEYTVTAETYNGTVYFYFEPPDGGWPVGTYRVEVFFNEAPSTTIKFTIQ